MSGSSGGKTAYHIIHPAPFPTFPHPPQEQTRPKTTFCESRSQRSVFIPRKTRKEATQKEKWHNSAFPNLTEPRTQSTKHLDGKKVSGRFAIAKSGLLLLFSLAGNTPLLWTTQERPRTICSSNLMQMWRDVPPATPGGAHFLSVTNQGAHLTRLHKV